MKILQISPMIPLPRDIGGKIGIYGVLKYLAERGNEMHFVGYRKNDDEKWAKLELNKFCKPYILDVQTENNIIEAFTNLFSPIPYNISKYIRKELKDFLYQFFKYNTVDLVHVDHLHMAWVVDIIKKIINIPITLRQHNLEMKIMGRFYEMQKNPVLKKFAQIQLNKFIKYEPQMCNKFDLCIMITPEDEKELLELNSKVKTVVIPVGVEASLLSFKKKDPIPYSLFHLGSMEWIPNYDGLQWYLSEIFPKLIKIVPQIKLYLYGKGTEKLKILTPLKKNIIQVGYVENIWTEIVDKQLAIVPLRIGGGIRVKIVEMLAIGQNIISTSIGKEGIDAKDSQHILIADSSEEFIEKTVKYFNNFYNNEQLSSNAKDLIRQKYTWEKIAENFELEYLHLINKFSSNSKSFTS